jgi:sec-independent protein translocase protein TatA
MGAFSIWHWVIVLAVVLVLFGGKGKISALMGDFGKGLKSFKKGMKDDGEDAKASEEAPKLSENTTESVDQTASEEKKSG